MLKLSKYLFLGILFIVYLFTVTNIVNAEQQNHGDTIKIRLRAVNDKRGFDQSSVNLVSASVSFWDNRVFLEYLGSEKTLVDLFKSKLLEMLSNDFVMSSGETEPIITEDYILDADLYRLWLTWEGSNRCRVEIKFGYLLYNSKTKSLIMDDYINYNEVLTIDKSVKRKEREIYTINLGMTNAISTFNQKLKNIKEESNV